MWTFCVYTFLVIALFLGLFIVDHYWTYWTPFEESMHIVTETRHTKDRHYSLLLYVGLNKYDPPVTIYVEPVERLISTIFAQKTKSKVSFRKGRLFGFISGTKLLVDDICYDMRPI